MSLHQENTITQLRLSREIANPTAVHHLSDDATSDSDHSLNRSDASSETDYSDEDIPTKMTTHPNSTSLNSTSASTILGGNGLENLVSEIKKILGPSSGINADDVDTETLMDTLRQYQSQRSDWEKYAFENFEVAYTRNGVDTINSKANLLVLVWTPGKGSAIHDHANAHCIVKMLQGSLRETLYDMPNGEDHDMHVTRVTDIGTNGISYMSDTLGLHRMENVGTVPAVSLHLYTPPYAAKYGCNVYDSDASKHHVSMSTLYSDKGVRVGVDANTC